MFVSSGYPSGTTTRTVAGPVQVVPVTKLPLGGCTKRLSPTVTTVQPGQQLLTVAGNTVSGATVARSPSTGGLLHQVTSATVLPSPRATTATPRTIFTHRKTRSEGGAAIQTPVRHLVAEASPISPAKSPSATAAPTTEQHTVVGIRTTKDGQKATLGGKTYSLRGVLGKGSFGVVYSGREDAADCEGREVAVKEIRCKSLKECQQAEYEATLLQKVTKENNECGRPSPGSDSRRIACPEWLASQKVATGPSQWTVLIAMEKVAGTPLDEFAKEVSNRRPYSEAVDLSRQLLEQLCPTLQKVSKLCVHRDINAHNILLTPASPPADSSASCLVDADCADPGSPKEVPKEAKAGAGNVFTLIDFGLATDWTTWRAGDWKVRDIGGDCRYWPVSSWKLFLFGYKYLLGNQQWTDEYVHNLDAHTVVLTCIQLIAEVSTGAWPEHAEPVREAWNQYWIDAMRFWKQLYSCFKGQGDWNALKSAFLQQQVAETTKRNLDKLRATLVSCASSSEEHSAFFTTLERMLAGKPVDWAKLGQLLEQKAPAAGAPAEEESRPLSPHSPKTPAPTFHHRRSRTIGSSQAFTQDVPQVGAARLEADNAASAAASGASTTASENAEGSTTEEERASPARMGVTGLLSKLLLTANPAAAEPGAEEDASELAPPRRNPKAPPLLRQITEEMIS